jgi:outer membrane lipoprotein-sorting protein
VPPSEFFDLLTSSPDRWTTLRMSGREWRDTVLSRQAWDAAIARKQASGMTFTTFTVGRSDLPQPRELEHAWTLWLAPPWKRATYTVATSTVDVVFHGTTWWSNSRGVSRSSESLDPAKYGHGLGYGEDLVRTRDYVTRLEVEEIGAGSWIDRPTLEVRARAVHRDRDRAQGLHGLIIGDADRIDLSVDRERGVILRAASWFERSMYRTVEALDVIFDETFPSDAFKIEPLPGQDWEPPSNPFRP